MNNPYDKFAEEAISLLKHNITVCHHDPERIVDEYKDPDRNRITVYRCKLCKEEYSVITKLKSEYKDD